MNAGRGGDVRLTVRGEDGAVAGAVAATPGAVLVDAEPDAVVVAGDAALCALADDVPDVPVLPVRSAGDRHAVGVDSLPGALAALVEGESRTLSHPILGVAVDGEDAGRAALDVSLVPGEPGRISEYGVHAGDETVDVVRADGVVVATPAGSAGYASAVGGPVLDCGGGLAVVPVAPFSLRSAAWVCVPPVSLTVERDESPVLLVLDDEAVREVDVNATVRVEGVATVEFLRVPGASGGE